MNRYDDFSRAKYIGLIYLAKRMLTGGELCKKLENKDFSPEVCEAAIQYFAEIGYINDLDYAERFITEGTAQKLHGATRIKRELAQKGVDRETIDKAFDNVPVDDREALKKLVCQRGAMLDLSDAKQKNRFVGQLVRKGFRYDDINAVIGGGDEYYFD